MIINRCTGSLKSLPIYFLTQCSNLCHWDEAMSLLKDFFDKFNCMFLLYHELTFMHLVERQYSQDPYEGSGWWASINIVLAIAYRSQVISNLVP
jgi:hypothetical protein